MTPLIFATGTNVVLDVSISVLLEQVNISSVTMI